MIFLTASTSFAQNPPAVPPKDDGEVVKISTTLIQVDATVTDKKGNIVRDLKPEEFEIYENGKKQTITNFSFVEVQSNNSPTEQITKQPNKNSIYIPPVSVNLRPEQVHRTIALVVNDLDLSFRSIDLVKSALKKYIDEQMQSDDLVAIIRTGGGGGFLQQFTSDKRILYKAIEHLRWNPAGSGIVNLFQSADPSDQSVSSGNSNNGLSADAQEKIKEQQGQSKSSSDTAQKQFDIYRDDIFKVGELNAVNYVIKGMRELPGRKAVVLFSEGFALYDLDNGIEKPNSRLVDALQRLTETANRSSIVIYAIDTRGLVVPMPGAEDNVIPTGGGKYSANVGVTSQQLINDRTNSLYENQQGLIAIAEQTGGFAIINNNSLSKGIERVLNDQNGYYLIGYQPDDETFDAQKVRFNKLIVKLKNPGLRVRYRSGFFSIKDEEAKPQAKTPQQEILAAINSPVNLGDIDLRLTSLFANDRQTGNFMRSLIYVNGNDLAFTNDTDGWEKATFDVVAILFGENGNIIDQISRTETIKARDETLKEIQEKGFISTITVPIKKPGAYQMRVVMRDVSTSHLGSASEFIEVPDLKKDRLTLSGILMQRVQPQSDNSQNIAKKLPFQSDEQRDIATRSFQPGTIVRFGYAIYNAKLDKATNSPNLKLQFKIFRDGEAIFTSKEKNVDIVDKNDLQHLLAEGVFNLGNGLKSGNYFLQVIVRDVLETDKKQIATQWVDFEIVE